MSREALALLSTLGTGTVLWALGAWAQKQGWIFSRQTEEHKLDRQRVKDLEEEVAKQLELIQLLRERIIDLKVKQIGSGELTEKERLLLVATPEEMHRLVRDRERLSRPTEE